MKRAAANGSGGNDSNTSTLHSKDSGLSTMSNNGNNPELRRSAAAGRDRPQTFAAASTSRPEYMNLPENSKAAVAAAAAAAVKPAAAAAAAGVGDAGLVSSSPAGNISLDSGFAGHGGSMNRSRNESRSEC